MLEGLLIENAIKQSRHIAAGVGMRRICVLLPLLSSLTHIRTVEYVNMVVKLRGRGWIAARKRVSGLAALSSVHLPGVRYERNWSEQESFKGDPS